MNLDAIARDIESRLREDMHATFRRYHHDFFFDPMLDDLVEDAMHHIEHLLVLHACDEQREMIDHE